MDKKVIDFVKQQNLVDSAVLLAFIEVETGGLGFSNEGKIIIQFEPAWFRKKAPFVPSGNWSLNKVDRQGAEWTAFNEAFKLNANAAMESTSIGLGQIMGFHWKTLGFNSVGAMWDNAKYSIENQITQIIQFIYSSQKLKKAIANKDWHMIATIYNGAKYKELAQRIGREPYNISLEKAYLKYSQIH